MHLHVCCTKIFSSLNSDPDNFATLPVTIRYATKDDAPLIAEISQQTFVEAFGADNTKENMDKFLNLQFSKPKLILEVGAAANIFLLAQYNGSVAGYAKLRNGIAPAELAGLTAMELARLYVYREMIGKGVGAALMQQCIDISISKMKQVIWLGVWERNFRAIDFYTKWGFEKFSETDFLLGDDVQKDWLMKRTL